MNPFWNAREARIRALLRIIVQLILFFLSFVLLTFLFTVPLTLFKARQSGTDLNGVMQIVASFGPLFLVAGMTFSLWLCGKFIDRRPMRDFGFHFSGKWWVDLGFGLMLGAVLMLFIYLSELALGWITVTGSVVSRTAGLSFSMAILVKLATFVGVGIYEEMLSRGYHLHNLAEGLNWKILSPKAAILIAYLISSSVFGAMHLGNPHSSLISTFNLIVAGLFLGLGFILTGDLAISIGLHITWNFFQGNVFGFPVSGTTTAATFITIQQGGPALWTGGAFGPEAGLLGLVALVLGSAGIILYVAATRGQVRIFEKLAVYQPKRQPEQNINTAVAVEESLQP